MGGVIRKVLSLHANLTKNGYVYEETLTTLVNVITFVHLKPLCTSNYERRIEWIWFFTNLGAES